MSKFMQKLIKAGAERDADIRSRVGTTSRLYLGDPALNWATGGLATGRANLFYGPSGSGKSTMALMAAAELQKKTGGWVVIFDSEYAYPSHTETYSDDHPRAGELTDDAKKQIARLKLFGLNPDMVYRRSSNKVDELFESLGDFEKELQNDPEFKISALIVDSWGGIQNEAGSEKIAKGDVAAAGNSFGGNAKTIGPIIQTLLRISAEYGVTGLYVQHCIQNMEQYGPRWKLIGGEKLKYLVHGILFLESIAAKDASLTAGDVAGSEDGVRVGKRVRFRCEKSRFVVEGRKGETWVNFHEARFALPEVSLFNLATGLGIIGHPMVAEKNKDGSVKKDKDGNPLTKEQTAYWEFPRGAATPSKWHGSGQVLEALKSNQDLFNSVREACEQSDKNSSIGAAKIGTEGEEEA